MFFSKPCTNYLREYKLETTIENYFSIRGIDYETKINKHEQLKSICFGYDLEEEKNDLMNYYFFMFSYNKRDISLNCDYAIEKDLFIDNFNFESSFFNELNDLILPMFEIELDYEYINKELNKAYIKSKKKLDDSNKIKIYDNGRTIITLFMENHISLLGKRMIKLKYHMSIR